MVDFVPTWHPTLGPTTYDNIAATDPLPMVSWSETSVSNTASYYDDLFESELNVIHKAVSHNAASQNHGVLHSRGRIHTRRNRRSTGVIGIKSQMEVPQPTTETLSGRNPKAGASTLGCILKKFFGDRLAILKSNMVFLLKARTGGSRNFDASSCNRRIKESHAVVDDSKSIHSNPITTYAQARMATFKSNVEVLSGQKHASS